MFHGPILKAVKAELPKIKESVDAIVLTLNSMLSNKKDDTFMVPIFDPAYPMNLTMTTAP